MNYREAGVDIGRKASALRAATAKIGETYTPEVLRGMGAFGGMMLASRLKEMREPVLVASTDGVGTKTLLAAQTGRYGGLGFDLVNHSVNDILVQGAKPLFFMDYIASARLEEAVLGAVLASLAEACKAVGIPLLGGETAEMPGVYQEGALELAGTIVGVVERAKVVDGSRVRPGDALLALPSSGLHTNGYSLARKAFEGWNLAEPREELAGRTLAEALLEPHRCYLEDVERLWQAGVEVKAMAHITGGGVYENLPRVLPQGLGAEIWQGSFPIPPIFRLIQRAAQVEEQEMYRVFNMGLGYILVVSPDKVDEVGGLLPQSCPVGRIIEGPGVHLV
ncbi:MAG: phosphoribosylformylglycinamidine cyclo-ligase [Meiothermus sp.]|uniref:phosphoribosylformylglycinamidine cyclo-ligase n=1 Tax=Meiothermus sp. TaxID=1955249 RepID=UPI0025CD84B4|nr:phosphoribosylformylglycinamidine cyclo-ligase [Meiothermus sp.]MCS7058162.1 phosphoribosylformylglycinamidine cyclo-ligase [Meiothermus sp.]MCS7193323.1 phosphoribosylformylglycinamidine cyclo-ligase [Meiothermus sp.]MCX7740876.1 phosphoribosylformylglycinamidine cyclo-ligase [Meiothermus sp.]MDW8091217.1 phosphoribosylformylglycinamidine cyclo-ligase [Meiothermus sp.]MDW8481997.1 phosphoribosylformylglycinamidine cyclo-ligase [Meiothermus sp.]